MVRVLSGGAGHVFLLALLAVLGMPVMVAAEIDEGVQAGPGAHDDVAAIAAVAAVGAAARHAGLAAERDGAVSAVTALDVNLSFVDKHD